MARSRKRLGLWLIGACGGVGSTVALGIAALRKGLTPGTGMVTALDELQDLPLANPADIVIGGHEIRSQSLQDAANRLHNESNVFAPELIKKCTKEFDRAQANIRPGVILGSIDQIKSMADARQVRRVSSGQKAIDAIRRDLESFRTENNLDHVVVMNVASSEPPLTRHAAHKDYDKLKQTLQRAETTVIPSSSLYALGAVHADCSYINFTPSTGIHVPAIEQVATDRGILFAGRDGKTGETLVKSVVAPMFAMRNLNVCSWVGHNVLGNRDGEVLSNPVVKASKLKSKDGLVSHIVGYKPDTRTSIEYIKSLNDWKVAWDFIHFEGFLNTRMSLQFTWTGCDSILAAPLVIDLALLTMLERDAGNHGQMNHLACFFKDPAGISEHNLTIQWQQFMQHLDRVREQIAANRTNHRSAKTKNIKAKGRSR